MAKTEQAVNEITRQEAGKRWGRSYQIGKCGKCSKLFAWPSSAGIERGRVGDDAGARGVDWDPNDGSKPPKYATPCCGAALWLTTWGKRTATVLGKRP